MLPEKTEPEITIHTLKQNRNGTSQTTTISKTRESATKILNKGKFKIG